ncbi:uncharacterized protein LOC142766803 [Rhipicephalus microplus]|uniref:uncharacterized protein LOC142766803 n=1 Tax=Rhipicephalus microplus TaxID=6941 RepID=UPI003F6D88CB
MSGKNPSDAPPSGDKNGPLGPSMDESVLTGWYSVINWFLRFILADPIDASFLKKVSHADVIESMDLYVRYEPQVALLYALGMVFFAAGIVGSVLYPQMRRRRMCGGDRTQDLNENMRCILQLYTAAYIIVLACILLGAMLMLASIFELKQSSLRHNDEFLLYVGAVQDFFRSMSVVAKQQQEANVNYLNELHRIMTDFSAYLKTHILSEIKAATTVSSSGGVMKAGNGVPFVSIHAKRKLTPTAQEAMAQLIATSVSKTYNDSLFECRLFAKNGSDRVVKFCQAVVADTEKSLHSFVNVSASLLKTDQLGVLSTLQHKSHWYIFLVLGSFLFLFLLYTGAFIMGMFHYNEDIPPTKRTDASNYAGSAMLFAIVLSFPVCAALMLVTNTIMLVSLSITNFACRPYENIVITWPGSIVDVMVLDDTFDMFWPRHTRGRWFGKFLAGTTLQICRTGRVFDVIGGDYKLAVEGYGEYMDNLYHLMISITIDPRLIFPAVAPPEIGTFYDDMKTKLWDKVGDMVEGYIKSIARGALNMRTNLSKFNPDCFLAYDGYEQAIGFICEGIIRNVNSFWTSLAFCLYMFTLLGTLSHFISKYFLRMDNYTYDGSEVESLTTTSEIRSSAMENGEEHQGSGDKAQKSEHESERGEKTDLETGSDTKRYLSSDEVEDSRRSEKAERIEKGPKWRYGRYISSRCVGHVVSAA